MKIEQSQVQLSAQTWLVREQIRSRQVLLSAARPEAPIARVSVSATPAFDFGDEPQDPKLLLMLRVAEMLLGRKIRLFHAPVKATAVAVQAPTGSPPQAPAQVRSVQVRVEAEQVLFHVNGSVETADGKRIDFQASLDLSRQFVEVTTSEGAAGGQKDPLVLNFDGKGVQLSGDRISIDLSGDGQPESTPVVAKGSAILFADRNGDGVANDGTELFGPQSGNGFTELAQLDVDQNGWIDQGDPVFGELRVWFQDVAGPGRVYSLTDIGIGAIYTSNAETPLDLRTAQNGLLGQIRRSGVYLQGNGKTGIVQQVDLAV